jgi:hypothetical protein
MIISDPHLLTCLERGNMGITETGVLTQEQVAKIAKDELNEEPDRVASDIQALKEWTAKQPHLQNIRLGN